MFLNTDSALRLHESANSPARRFRQMPSRDKCRRIFCSLSGILISSLNLTLCPNSLFLRDVESQMILFSEIFDGHSIFTPEPEFDTRRVIPRGAS